MIVRNPIVSLVLLLGLATAASARDLVVLESFGPGSYFTPVVSPDGRIVSSVVSPQFSNRKYVRWVDGVAEVLFSSSGSFPDSDIAGMTPDGTTIVGRIQGGHDHEAIRWNDAGLTRLGFLLPSSYTMSDAYDVTADGRTIVGWSYQTPRSLPVQWIDGAIETLPLPADHPGGYARVVSDDGSRIAGETFTGPTLRDPLRFAVWDDGVLTEFGGVPGEPGDVRVGAITRNGSHVAGSGVLDEERRAFLWDGVGFDLLDSLPRDLGAWPTGVSDDAEVVVGYVNQEAGSYCQGDCPDLRTPFVWTPETGMRPLREYLQYGCGYTLDRWELADPALADTGRFVAMGVWDPDGEPSIAVAEIGDSCDPDYEVPENPIEPGDYIVANGGVHRGNGITHLDRETGAMRFLSQGGEMYGPGYVAQSASGELLVNSLSLLFGVDLETGAQRIIAFLESSTPTIAVAPSGRVFVTQLDRSPHPDEVSLVEVDLETGELTTVAEGPHLHGATYVDRGPLVASRSGELYYVGSVDGEVALLRIDPDTGAWSPIAVGDLPEQTSLALTEDDELVFLDYDGIRIVDAATGARRFVEPQLEAAGLPFLNGAATSIDSSGRLLVPGPFGHHLVAVDLDTGEITELGSRPLSFAPRHPIELRATCDDGLDNDGDGRVDAPGDPGCDGAADSSEVDIAARILIEVLGRRADGERAPDTGLIRVIVFGSEDFDVRSLDPGSVRFGPGDASPRPRGAEPRRDENLDGHVDWTFLFEESDVGLAPTDRDACLSARTHHGTPVHGCALVLVRGACGLGFEVAGSLIPLAALRRRFSRRRLPVSREAHPGG